MRTSLFRLSMHTPAATPPEYDHVPGKDQTGGSAAHASPALPRQGAMLAVKCVSHATGTGCHDVVVLSGQAKPAPVKGAAWRTRWQKKAEPESCCILEVKSLGLCDLDLQVVFTNKASLPDTMRLYFGPKQYGPFAPACAELQLPHRTKHRLSFSNHRRGQRFLKIAFSGVQQEGQASHSIDALLLSCPAAPEPPTSAKSKNGAVSLSTTPAAPCLDSNPAVQTQPPLTQIQTQTPLNWLPSAATPSLPPSHCSNDQSINTACCLGSPMTPGLSSAAALQRLLCAPTPASGPGEELLATSLSSWRTQESEVLGSCATSGARPCGATPGFTEDAGQGWGGEAVAHAGRSWERDGGEDQDVTSHLACSSAGGSSSRQQGQEGSPGRGAAQPVPLASSAATPWFDSRSESVWAPSPAPGLSSSQQQGQELTRVQPQLPAPPASAAATPWSESRSESVWTPSPVLDLGSDMDRAAGEEGSGATGQEEGFGAAWGEEGSGATGQENLGAACVEEGLPGAARKSASASYQEGMWVGRDVGVETSPPLAAVKGAAVCTPHSSPRASLAAVCRSPCCGADGGGTCYVLSPLGPLLLASSAASAPGAGGASSASLRASSATLRSGGGGEMELAAASAQSAVVDAIRNIARFLGRDSLALTDASLDLRAPAAPDPVAGPSLDSPGQEAAAGTPSALSPPSAALWGELPAPGTQSSSSFRAASGPERPGPSQGLQAAEAAGAAPATMGSGSWEEASTPAPYGASRSSQRLPLGGVRSSSPMQSSAGAAQPDADGEQGGGLSWERGDSDGDEEGGEGLSPGPAAWQLDAAAPAQPCPITPPPPGPRLMAAMLAAQLQSSGGGAEAIFPSEATPPPARRVTVGASSVGSPSFAPAPGAADDASHVDGALSVAGGSEDCDSVVDLGALSTPPRQAHTAGMEEGVTPQPLWSTKAVHAPGSARTPGPEIGRREGGRADGEGFEGRGCGEGKGADGAGERQQGAAVLEATPAASPARCVPDSWLGAGFGYGNALAPGIKLLPAECCGGASGSSLELDLTEAEQLQVQEELLLLSPIRLVTPLRLLNTRPGGVDLGPLQRGILRQAALRMGLKPAVARVDHRMFQGPLAHGLQQRVLGQAQRGGCAHRRMETSSWGESPELLAALQHQRELQEQARRQPVLHEEPDEGAGAEGEAEAAC